MSRLNNDSDEPKRPRHNDGPATVWDGLFADTDVQDVQVPSSLGTELVAAFAAVLPARATLLEAGSGSGQLSAQLALSGYDVTLADVSQEALLLSQKVFAAHAAHGSFIDADLFNLPFPDGSFDCVWNSGVMEHFSDEEIVRGVREMARASRDVVAVLVPNARALFYRMGKWTLEQKGQWPFGLERPKETLTPLFAAAGLVDVVEGYVAIDMGLHWLAHLGPGAESLAPQIAEWIATSGEERIFEPGIAYLLLTMGRKKATTATRQAQPAHKPVSEWDGGRAQQALQESQRDGTRLRTMLMARLEELSRTRADLEARTEELAQCRTDLEVRTQELAQSRADLGSEKTGQERRHTELKDT